MKLAEIKQELGDVYNEEGVYDTAGMSSAQKELVSDQKYIQHVLSGASGYSGGGFRSRGVAPADFDPAELEGMIRQEQKNIRDLRARQAGMIEQGPGAIFSPFDRNYMTETLFRRDLQAFPHIERGKVYETGGGVTVGITKEGSPFAIVGGEELQPPEGSQEYLEVVEMLDSLRPE